jgi:trehalose-6-phosphate synthase
LERCRFTLADWQGYERVNRKFASRLAREHEPGNVIWVHDYHLCLVPRYLRSMLPDTPIAYFHHIPFPSPDVFRVLPWHTDVLSGLLAADQVGFHTESYKRNFLATCALLPGATVDFTIGAVYYQGHATHVGAFPIGIDVNAIDRFATSEDARQGARRIRKDLRVERLLLSVDRLDYTKGIIERFEALDEFFERRPDLKGLVSLLQIAVPCRENVSEYRALKRRVDELIGRVNGRHSQNGWQPIHCTYRSYSPKRLVAYYQAADVALVTPVRDGMNLVAKEFCASRADGDGVLVLSELAGVAEQLGAAALLVNPYDLMAFTATIDRALSMNVEERRNRMYALRNVVTANRIENWVDSILTSLILHNAEEQPLRA